MTADTDALTCRDVSEFLGAYFENRLGPDERVRFDRHLAVCADCVAYLRQYEATIRLARDVCEGDAREAGIPDELVDAIIAVRPKTPPRRRQ